MSHAILPVTDATTVNILAVTGSLRAASSNTLLLRATALLAPGHVRISVFTALDTLPPFNPDLDREGSCVPLWEVHAFRERVRRAHALLISSPEYAHGVPGVLKNALDWLVSVPDLSGKPVGLLDASPRSTHARASLAETLRTMSLNVVAEASKSVLLPRPVPDAAALAAHPEVGAALRDAIAALLAEVAGHALETHVAAPAGAGAWRRCT